MESKEIIILLLFALILILLIWILAMRTKFKRDTEKERKVVREDADKEIKTRTDALLRLSILPFLWAMRAELLQGNLTQIEQYFNQYVKEPGISYVALIDLAESIRLATDKKTEGKPFRELHKYNITGLEGIKIIDRDHDERVILAPITGINEKLGTIMVIYHPREI